MRTFYSLLLAAILTGTFGSSCNIINPSEPVPTYIQIDSFSFNRGKQLGSGSHKITNVWVYFNNSPVGNFDLPARFPVIANEPGTLTVAPGIDYYGLHGVPGIYFLYLGDTMTIAPRPGETISFKPGTGYSPYAKLQFEENFDAGAGLHNSFRPWRSVDTSLFNITGPAQDVFEGNGSGVIYLGPGRDSSIVLSGDINPIDVGQDAYIELDYKGELTLRVGMYAINSDSTVSTQQIIGLYPRQQWGKIYVGVKQFIASHPKSTFKVLIRADKPDDANSGRLYIDNVKVVSF